MIPGTGPGRGVPWWRQGRLLIWSWSGSPDPEPVGQQREGRTVKKIRT